MIIKLAIDSLEREGGREREREGGRERERESVSGKVSNQRFVNSCLARSFD